MPRAAAPTMGPMSVPRPPTMVQMITSADWPKPKMPGVTISAQLANRHPANPAMVDARSFIARRVPTCEIEPRNRNCWTPSAGVAMTDAVARTDSSTFYRVLPGTRVRFTIVFSNIDVFPGYEDRSTLFHAYIHVVGDGFARLDTREVFILVPARASNPG